MFEYFSKPTYLFLVAPRGVYYFKPPRRYIMYVFRMYKIRDAWQKL